MGVSYSIVPKIKHPELTAVDRLVWEALCSFTEWTWDTDKKPLKGICRAGRGKLAEYALCTVRTVTNALKHLEEMGLISKTRTRTQNGNGWAANQYTLTPVQVVGNDVPKESHSRVQEVGNDVPKESHSRGVGNYIPEGRELQSRGVGNDVPTINNKKERKNKKGSLPPADLHGQDTSPEAGGTPHAPDPSPEDRILTSEEADKLFNAFFAIYPNKTFEGEARRAFRQVIKPGMSRGESDPKFDDMLARLERDSPSWATEAGELKFCPRADKWLRGTYGDE